MSSVNLFLKPESTLKLNSSVNTLISAPSFQHPTLGGSLSNLSNLLDSTDFSHNGSNLILKSLSYAKMADVPSESVSTLSFIQEPVAGYETVERMYPPVRTFTSSNVNVTTGAYGNGMYNVTYSSAYGFDAGIDVSPYKCFNTGDGVGGVWGQSSPTLYNAGTYRGTESIDGVYKGDWLKIKLPVSIKLTKYSFLQRTATLGRAPKDFKIYGSNDGTVWTKLVEKTTISYHSTTKLYEEIINNVQTYYQYYGLVVNKLVGTDATEDIVLNFDEWFIYGKEFIPSVQATLIPTAADYKYLAFTYGYPTLTADATNLKAWYKFDDNFNDSTGNGFNLTNTDTAVTIVDGFIGKSASFPNSESSLTTNNINLNGKTYSIAFWAKLNTTIASSGNERWFWSQSSSGASGKFVGLQTIQSSNKLRFTHYGGGNDIDTISEMSTTIGTSWHHYVVTYNDTNNGVEIWLDGVRQTNSPATMTNKFTGSGEFKIGRSILNSVFFNGLMEDFRYYDKVLSITEIQQLAANNSSQTSYTVNFPNPAGTLCDILVVGGGGGGGGGGADTRGGGGGGAGRFMYIQSQTISNNSIVEIKVGAGGAGGIGVANGNNGQVSSIIINGTEYSSIGGGGGARGEAGGKIQGLSGASGGGGVGDNNTTYDNPAEYGGAPTIAFVNDNTLYTGFAGGKGGGNYHGGGGGGYKGVGGDAIAGQAGNGGIGIDNNITGSNLGYAGGGGGGVYIGYVNAQNNNPEQAGNATHRAGKGGGYNVALNNKYSIQGTGAIGENAIDGSGSGGGGATAGMTGANLTGGNGGSGIVIIRYKLTTGTNTSFKPPAILKYLPNPTPPQTKWQPIINPSSTSDFLMTLSSSSNFSNLQSRTTQNFFDLYHSNIMSPQTDSYRIILNASIDHQSTDGNKYISSALYYTKTPSPYFVACNISFSTPQTDWSFANLSDRLRIGVLTSNLIPTLKVNL
jgi:hypothetical protein